MNKKDIKNKRLEEARKLYYGI